MSENVPDQDADLGRELRTKMGLFTPEELAALLKVEDQTLALWRHKKHGPDFIKLGKRVFYRREDLTEWMASNIVLTNRTVMPEGA